MSGYVIPEYPALEPFVDRHGQLGESAQIWMKLIEDNLGDHETTITVLNDPGPPHVSRPQVPTYQAYYGWKQGTVDAASSYIYKFPNLYRSGSLFVVRERRTQLPISDYTEVRLPDGTFQSIAFVRSPPTGSSVWAWGIWSS